MHEHVGAADHVNQLVPLVLFAKVDHNAFLASVERHEDHRRRAVVLTGERRPPAPRVVTLRSLDLDHLGAQESQDLSAIGSREVLAELDDFYAVKRSLGHGVAPERGDGGWLWPTHTNPPETSMVWPVT